MAQQIIVTQGNFGIELDCYIVDSKKLPINITGCSVEIAFLNPSGVQVDLVQALIKNANLGWCSTVLSSKHTSDEGLYTTIWTVTDNNGYVTAQEDVYYYVKAKEQSSDVQEDLVSADGLKERIISIEDKISNLELAVEDIRHQISLMNK